jgi:two-component system sensor histidine kinase ArlS
MRKNIRSLSLTARLSLLFTGGMVFFLLILNLFVYLTTMQLVYRHEHQLLQSKVAVMIDELNEEMGSQPSISKVRLEKILHKFTNEYQAVSLIDSHGRVLAASKGRNWKEESVQNDRKIFIPNSYFVTEKSALRDVRTIAGPHGSSPLTVEVVEDTEPLNHFIRLLLLILGTASIGAILISGIGGYFLTRLGLWPLNRLIDALSRMEASQLSFRLVSRTETEAKEITTLTDTFNQLLTRIETVVARQRQFISDASHELRTPLTIIDGYIRLLNRWGKDDETVREEAVQAMQQESKRLFSLLNDLLTLAKAEETPISVENLEAHDLSLLLQEVKHAWVSAIPSHLSLICSWESPLILRMDREKIRRLIDILVDNACKYTDEGEIRLNAWKEGNNIHIAVEDTGIGIEEKELPHVFERFYRVDKSRSRQRGGSGLGLSIAKSIVDMHRGVVNIERMNEGGTRVHVVLPES